MTGSSATIHPITPLPASAIMSTSAGLRPPSPRRIESRKTALVRTACAAAMIRLHDAPSARCDRHTTIARTLQMSQVPRWGRVLPPTVSRTYGMVSAMPPRRPAGPERVRCRSSVEHPQRERAAEVRDRDRGRGAGVERPAGEDVHKTPIADLIGVDGDGAGLDELHRRPALELTIAEPVQHER